MSEPTQEDRTSLTLAVTRTPRIAVVGVHGFGAFHVQTALDLQHLGRAALVGLVDTQPGPVSRNGVALQHDVPLIHPTLEDLLEHVDVDIVAVATPLHTHAALAEKILLHGADVLLEKPPVVETKDLNRLLDLEQRTGNVVQVGFQSLGSRALTALTVAIREGKLGCITSIAVHGSWSREISYWTRAAWAGKRTLDGIRVADGAVSNPFAHGVMTALALAGWTTSEHIDRVEFDLRRVNAIESDDTSSLRIHPSLIGRKTFDGCLSCAFTLAGPRENDPAIEVIGTAGSARLDYAHDRLTFGGGTPSAGYGRVGLLENLIEFRRGTDALLSPLNSTGGFVSVIERMAKEPVHKIDPSFVTWKGEGGTLRPSLEGVENTVQLAAKTGRLFREMENLPWR